MSKTSDVAKNAVSGIIPTEKKSGSAMNIKTENSDDLLKAAPKHHVDTPIPTRPDYKKPEETLETLVQNGGGRVRYKSITQELTGYSSLISRVPDDSGTESESDSITSDRSLPSKEKDLTDYKEPVFLE